MKVTKARLVISAALEHQFPVGPFPEIALSGRSNVGKSSFINTVIGRRGLARTSQRPGKTQTLNFYFINERFHFVDVPGYGYAKVSKKAREAWGRVMEGYIETRKQLKGVVQLIDARHNPTEDDMMMYDLLKYHSLPVLIVGTKADKVSQTKRSKCLNNIRKVLQVEDSDHVILFSSETGYGKDKAWGQMSQLLFSAENRTIEKDEEEQVDNDSI